VKRADGAAGVLALGTRNNLPLPKDPECLVGEEVAMGDREPTIRSRELGEGLRQAMEGAGLNGRQAAYLLGWSESWVSRLLSGKRGGNALDIAAFLGACRVKSPERDRLLALCQEQNTPGNS
jgi:hypothetical protein